MNNLDRMMDEIGSMNGTGGDDGMGGHGNVIKNKGVNVKLFVIALILSAVVWVIDMLLYNAFKDALPRPVTIGVVFALLALALGILLVIFGRDSGNEVEPAIQIAGAVAGPILMLVLAALLQYIYQLSLKSVPTEPTSYIFLIDNSGSMQESDPQSLRYTAIEEILREKPDDFPYMVYGFSDNSYVMREMGPKSDGMQPNTIPNNGGTGIATTLENVISDHENGLWDGGSVPKVVLLTDGFATDIIFGFGLDGTLEKYEKAGISVSCVGLGEVDRELMDKIASSTGGVFVDVNDVSQLSAAMKTAATGTKETDRDLISQRRTGNGILYGAMRVIFLTLLGALLGVIKYVTYGDRDSVKTLVLLTTAASLVGAFLMEIGNGIGLPSFVLWLILWLLYAVTIADKSIYVQTNIAIDRYGGGSGNTGNIDDLMGF